MHGTIADQLRLKAPELAANSKLYVMIASDYSSTQDYVQTARRVAQRLLSEKDLELVFQALLGHAKNIATDMDAERNRNGPSSNATPLDTVRRDQTERGQDMDAAMPDDNCPAQSFAKGPTLGQIAGRFAAKLSGAKSLFNTVRLADQPVGNWTYTSLLAIERDGAFAKALILEIGSVSEFDRGREIRDLLGGSEERLRRAMASCGMKRAV